MTKDDLSAPLEELGRLISQHVEELQQHFETLGRSFLGPIIGLFPASALAKIDRVLGIASRDQIARAIFEYWLKKLMHAAPAHFRKRLTRMGSNATKLQSDARALCEGIDSAPTGPMAAELWAMSQFMKETGITDYTNTLDSLVESLSAVILWAEVAAQPGPKDPGGHAWNELMLDFIAIYESRTKRDATVTHHPVVSSKYGGVFFDLAALIDQAAAKAIGEEPKTASALGPRLIRLIKDRRGLNDAGKSHRSQRRSKAS
jgi:hypothetical protein